jgi:hypothetical protein
VLLHIGGASPASVGAVVALIFLLIFAMSFAFGSVPEGERKFTRPWANAWLKASAPRFAIAAAFAVAVFVGSALFGSPASTASGCDNPLPPLTGATITDARLVTAIDSLNEMTSAANSGDQERVRTLFFTTDAHNLTHDIDRPLRQQDLASARTLCSHVIALENQIAGPLELPQIATQTRNIADDLQKARGILAAVLITTPVATAGFDPCAQPLPAITTEPLTNQRIQSAIDQLHQASQLAQSGDKAGAQAAFVGAPHNLTHDIDAPLRGVDGDLAVRLCQSIVAIELHLGDKYDAQVMQTQASTSADLLARAASALGITS